MASLSNAITRKESIRALQTFLPLLNDNGLRQKKDKMKVSIHFPHSYSTSAPSSGSGLSAVTNVLVLDNLVVIQRANLGADYMSNFSPVSRAEVSARLPEQISLKRRLRLHEESIIPS